MRRMATIAVALGVIAGCNRGAQQPIMVDAGAGAPKELAATMNVRVGSDSVMLSLHLTNATSGPITLEFSSGQRYDFAVARPDGEILWTWSMDKSFIQAVGTETLAQGESREYHAVWPVRLGAGSYVGTARLTSTNYPVELRTVFER